MTIIVTKEFKHTFPEKAKQIYADAILSLLSSKVSSNTSTSGTHHNMINNQRDKDTMQLASEYILQDGSGVPGDGPGGGQDSNDTGQDNDNTTNSCHSDIANLNNNMTGAVTLSPDGQIKGKIPSRASSGASSSGFLSYRQSNNSTNYSSFATNHNNSNHNLNNQSQLDRDNASNTPQSNRGHGINSIHNSSHQNHNDLSSDEGTGEELFETTREHNIHHKHNSSNPTLNHNHSPNISQNIHNSTVPPKAVWLQSSHMQHSSLMPSYSPSQNSSSGDRDVALFKDLKKILLTESQTEAELWQIQVKDHSPNFIQTLPESEIKRQETIYEFIKTERSHFRTLLLMIDVWYEGLQTKALRHIKVPRLLPGIEAMSYQSCIFLNALHDRQKKQYPVINHIGDVLANHWQEHEEAIKDAFGHFCSLHGDALVYYKDLMVDDKKFAQFINGIRLQGNTRRLDLPDCLQLAMQRITKYSIMVNKIKERTANRASEILDLEAAIDCIEVIAETVDQKVTFVNKERRLLQICKKLDQGKTTKTVGRKVSFGKDDLKYDKRRLLFETRALVRPTGLPSKPSNSKKNKEPMESTLLLMTDYLVMLKTNSGTKLLTNITSDKHSDKHSLTNSQNSKFATLGSLGNPYQDKDNVNYQFISFSTGQPSVLPLRGLIVRENPSNVTGRYLLSAKHVEIGLYELTFDNADTALYFAEQTRLAAQNCPDDDVFNEDYEKKKLDSDEENSRREYEQALRKCDDLMSAIRTYDARILENLSLKTNAYNEIEAVKNKQKVPPAPVRYMPTENPERITVAPIIKECQNIVDDVGLPRDHKLHQALSRAYAITTQQDSTLAQLRIENEKLQMGPAYHRESNDLNKMERIHEIESKRFDRLRRKDRDELKRMQLQLDHEREELDQQRKNLENQRDSLERQKSELDVEHNCKLKDIKSKEKSYFQQKQYEDDVRKNAEQQRMLMKMRDMQRYIDDLESRLDVNDSSTNSPKSYNSASPSNSFGKADKLLQQQNYGSLSHQSSSKRSNSHGASDSLPVNMLGHSNTSLSSSGNIPSHIGLRGATSYSINPHHHHLGHQAGLSNNNSSLRRGESLSPDRNSNKHVRSKSNISSKSGSSSQQQQSQSNYKIPERLAAEQMLLPLQLAANVDNNHSVTRSKTSVSNDDSKLRPLNYGKVGYLL